MFIFISNRSGVVGNSAHHCQHVGVPVGAHAALPAELINRQITFWEVNNE